MMPAGSCGSNSAPSASAAARRNAVADSGSWVGHWCRPTRATASASGGAPRGQPHPGQALLRGLHRVEPLVADGHAEPADLADRLGDALEQVGVLLDEEAGPPVAAGLFVRGEGEHDVPGGLTALS
jgi:hypothetical protein